MVTFFNRFHYLSLMAYPRCPMCGCETVPVCGSEWNKGRYMCINYEADVGGVHLCGFIEGVYYNGVWSKCLYEAQPEDSFK